MTLKMHKNGNWTATTSYQGRKFIVESDTRRGAMNAALDHIVLGDR